MRYSLDLSALREARHAKGLTQPQLSDLVGVDGAPRVSAWESGQQVPHPGQLRRLAEVLEVPITQLLEPVSVEDRDLRRLRIEAGLTIVELGARIHVAGPTLKRWERGEVQGLLRRIPLGDMADVLRVDEATVTAALRRTQSS
ncbi:helix-turn-helix transcriptional regulator [Aeromicrobium panaciterrae]|uniref:helix-turn-helix transcriptional regulator n=1 Tax=Aeromicrobium panaciterrae TaxID=363861 RepID=UPI0031D8F1F7